MIRGTGRVQASVAAASVLALVATGCTGTKVRTIEKSMEPTIRSGEFVELDSYAYEDGSEPRRGDLISFRGPSGVDTETCGEPGPEGAPCMRPTPELSPETSLIKRVIALPGDTIAIAADGRAILNGTKREEPYVIPCKPEDECGLPEEIDVPDGHLFVMGDNRPYSGDSRHFGPIDMDGLEGRVTPPER
jgi:signal peptidase I